jgi:transposase-like protein
MTNTKDIAQLIIDESKFPDYLGRWSDFCRRNGFNRHQVFHWRKKLGLALRAPAGAALSPRDGGQS